MDDGTRAGLTGGWHGYLQGLALAHRADGPLHLEASSGEAVLAEAEAWARQGPWPSGLFTKEPTRVLVLAGFGGSDSDLSRAIADRLATGFLQDQPGVPLPLRITLARRQDGEGARELLSRHLRQAGLTIVDWRRLELPSLVTIDGLDDLLPLSRALPGSEGLELLSELCSYEFSQSRIMLVTRRQPGDTPHWQLITDRLDGGANRVTVLDAASGPGGPDGPDGREERQVAGDTTRTWVLAPPERSVLRVMLQAHDSGMDWLGLTNVAIPAGLSLDETAAALAKPVQLGYVEQHGERGAIYQLTGEGRRIAAARPGPAELDFPQAPQAASPRWPTPPAAHAPGGRTKSKLDGQAGSAEKRTERRGK
jgi:hypothetical protein